MTHPALAQLKYINDASRVAAKSTQSAGDEQLTPASLEEAAGAFAMLLAQVGTISSSFNDSGVAETLGVEQEWDVFFQDLATAQRSAFHFLIATRGGSDESEPETSSAPWVGPH